MISDRDHHNNTEPSVVADDKAMNRDEPYEARGRQFPEAVDIQGPGEDGEHAARPEKRQKVGGLDVPTAAQDDDLKKPAAVDATVDKASDDATAMLLTNQSLTATGAMPTASAFAGAVAGISDPSIGTATSKPLQQAMNPPPGFLPPQHQSQQPIFVQNQQALPSQQTVAPSNNNISINNHLLQQQQQQQQQINPQARQTQSPFFPLGNQALLQNQLAAYQAGLMGLPPQFLQQALMQQGALLPQATGGLGAASAVARASPDTAVETPLSAEDAAKMSGRKPQPLYMSCDDDSLSEYQCLVRKQIELFEARPEDVASNAKGRNKPIVIGQVGIRCKHCRLLRPKSRQRGATYYPAKLNGLYQAAQSMASGHLCYHCQHIPPQVRQELLVLRERKSSAGGGKKYWGDGVSILGVYEDENGRSAGLARHRHFCLVLIPFKWLKSFSARPSYSWSMV